MARRYRGYTRTTYQKTREVKGGGIKARSRRGQFAETWWGKRWLEVLGSFLEPGRLKRGRTYARKGQVCSLNIAPGEITAAVQGSRPRPYEVEIELDVLSDEEWTALSHHFSEDASLVATLLNGELPEDSERLFQDLEIDLLPKSESDIDMYCSCPDYAVPCKHLAAVLCLIAEELDADAFLLFLLRGKKREDFLATLDATTDAQPAGEDAYLAEPLPADPKSFWKSFDPAVQHHHHFNPPSLHAALPKRLGPLPFWQGEDPFIDTMEHLYEQASENALEQITRAEKEGDRE